jgi:hypothetical protein
MRGKYEEMDDQDSNLILTIQRLNRELAAERQKVADLQELLDHTRQIALELDQKVLRGKT